MAARLQSLAAGGTHASRKSAEASVQRILRVPAAARKPPEVEGMSCNKPGSTHPSAAVQRLKQLRSAVQYSQLRDSEAGPPPLQATAPRTRRQQPGMQRATAQEAAMHAASGKCPGSPLEAAAADASAKSATQSGLACRLGSDAGASRRPPWAPAYHAVSGPPRLASRTAAAASDPTCKTSAASAEPCSALPASRPPAYGASLATCAAHRVQPAAALPPARHPAWQPGPHGCLDAIQTCTSTAKPAHPALADAEQRRRRRQQQQQQQQDAGRLPVSHSTSHASSVAGHGAADSNLPKRARPSGAVAEPGNNTVHESSHECGRSFSNIWVGQAECLGFLNSDFVWPGHASRQLAGTVMSCIAG